MNEVESLIERNKTLAAKAAAAGTLQPSLPEALPGVKAIIIGCADMRVDPVHVLGIEPGEAVVMRNIGGRVVPGLLAQMGMLGTIGQVAGETPGGGGEFHIIVLHHTDCGITRLADQTEMLSQYFGTDKAGLNAKAVRDPRAAVTADVEMLRGAGLPGPWLLSGLVYNVGTGLVDTIVAPAPVAAA